MISLGSVKVSHRHMFSLMSLILVIVFSVLIISWNSNNYALDSCTIFSVSRDGRTFFCNNEDEGLRHGRIWFLPGVGDQYGLVLFCYGIYRNAIVPVGGMNDQGLCLDTTIVSETQIHLDPNKPDYFGTFFLDMLRVCATVEEARMWVRSCDLLMLHWQQVHIADKSGDATVVGLNSHGDLWLTNSSEDYLISIPVNHAQKTYGFGDRYETVESTLSTMSELTIDGCREILRTASVPATMYSYICDQQNGSLYLYSRGDFSRVAILNVTVELGKGEHSYDIEKLISQQAGQIGSPDTLGDVTGIMIVGCTIAFSLVITVVKIRGKKVSKFKGIVVQEGQTGGQGSSESISPIEPWKRFILTAMVFFALIVLSSTVLRIPIVIPTHWVSVAFFLYMTPIFLYTISTMVRPWITLAICFPSLALGELLWCSVYGCAGELPLNVLLASSTWGIGCLLISLLRSKKEVVAMLIGTLWGFFGLLIPALIYYALILDWSPLYMVVYSLLSTALNLALIPVSLLLNHLLRRLLKMQSLDELLLLQPREV